MKIGFSTLALFMKSFEDMLDHASGDGFDLMEILCEGPYWPRNILNNGVKELEIFQSYDITVFLHSPTIDLNPASLNQGIREETRLQLIETVDLAVKIGAQTITTHPGIIRRKDAQVRKFALEHAIETLTLCTDYAKDRGINFSVENMPNRFSYICNSAPEHQKVVNECGCGATVDMGHANTSRNPEDFLKIKNTYYYHLSDNDGVKDQHLPLGEGNLDLKLLNNIDKGIIELNKYENVLKSRKLIKTIN